MRTRRLSAVLVGTTMALMLAGSTLAFAANTYLHQTGTAIGPDDAAQNCEGAPALDPGEVAWHFILNQTDGSFAAQGHFVFASGWVEQTSDPHGSGRDWYVVTGDTTLDGSQTYTDGVTTGQFNLSHVCQADSPPPTPTPTLPQDTPTPTLPQDTPTPTLPQDTPTPSLPNDTPTPTLPGETPTASPTLPPTATSPQGPSMPAGTGLNLVLGFILLAAGGLTAYAMRPRRGSPAKR